MEAELSQDRCTVTVFVPLAIGGGEGGDRWSRLMGPRPGRRRGRISTALWSRRLARLPLEKAAGTRRLRQLRGFRRGRMDQRLTYEPGAAAHPARAGHCGGHPRWASPAGAADRAAVQAVSGGVGCAADCTLMTSSALRPARSNNAVSQLLRTGHYRANGWAGAGKIRISRRRGRPISPCRAAGPLQAAEG